MNRVNRVDERVKRLNELAQKSRTVGLTDEEKDEQQRLRQEYVKAFRAGLDGMLDGVFVAVRMGKYPHQDLYEG